MGEDECGSCVADGIFGLSFLREVTGEDLGGWWRSVGVLLMM